MKTGKLKVYVGKNQHPDFRVDGKYHSYYIVEEHYDPRTAVNHDEEYLPPEKPGTKGTYRRRGDYMVGPGFFDPDYCKEVQPCECSPSIIFEEYGLVRTLPNHSDHEESGFGKSYKYVVNQDDC